MAPSVAGSSPGPCASPKPGGHDGDRTTSEKEETPSAADDSDNAANGEKEKGGEEGEEEEGEEEEKDEEEEEAQGGVNRPAEAHTADNGKYPAECSVDMTPKTYEETETKNAGEDGTTSDDPPAKESSNEPETKDAGEGETSSEKALGEKSVNIQPPAGGEAEDGEEVVAPRFRYPPPVIKPANNQLPPPAWAEVTFEELPNYPKSSLRAQSYFELPQIRAIKPLTLVAMGISIPGFPDVATDRLIGLILRPGAHQLYYPADVLPTKKKSKAFLQKEIVRRAILHSLRRRGEAVTYNDVPRSQLSGRLPRPGSYSLAQCITALKDHPLPAEEHVFVLESMWRWKQQIRDQLDKMDEKTPEVEAALTEFDELRAKCEGELREKYEAAAAKANGVTAQAVSAEDQAKALLGHYAELLSAVGTNHPLANYNAQLMPPNAMPYQMPPTHQQLATAININNFQAQLISQYQSQLAQVQNQVATPNRAHFELFVSKDTFKFNASHFVAYPGFRERLHGHNYRVSVRVIGSHTIGRDGYVLDFGCVKSVTKDVCKELNEYFLVPMLSDVLEITVEEEEEEEADKGDDPADAPPKKKRTRRRKRSQYPGSVKIVTEDGATFIFPRQDCLLLPLMHSTAEELGVYLYGKILQNLDSAYLRRRGVTAMEVTVSEAVGQEAVFRHGIPEPGGKEFDVASYVTQEDIPVMPCATETEAAKQRVYKL